MYKRWMSVGALLGVAVLALPAGAQKPGAQKPGKKQARRGAATVGRITAVSDSGFSVQLRGKQATDTVNVTVDSGTQFRQAKQGTVADLKSNHLAMVVGETGADGKLAATGILQLEEATGPVNRKQLAGGRGAAGMLGARRGPKAAAGTGAKRTPPAMGKIVSTSPLTLQRVGKKKQAGGNVEIVTSTATRVVYYAPLTLKDLKVGDVVNVASATPRAEGQSGVKATLVTKVPGMQRRGKKAKVNANS